jgi:hypothetical protein
MIDRSIDTIPKSNAGKGNGPAIFAGPSLPDVGNSFRFVAANIDGARDCAVPGSPSIRMRA